MWGVTFIQSQLLPANRWGQALLRPRGAPVAPLDLVRRFIEGTNCRDRSVAHLQEPQDLMNVLGRQHGVLQALQEGCRSVCVTFPTASCPAVPVHVPSDHVRSPESVAVRCARVPAVSVQVFPSFHAMLLEDRMPSTRSAKKSPTALKRRTGWPSETCDAKWM